MNPGVAKADTILPDGRHLYWSTHCRHASTPEEHAACAAVEHAPGVPRKPAQCKVCEASCDCECHIR